MHGVYKMKLDDKKIRNEIKNRLSEYKDCYIFDEFTVPSGKARADLVAINGHITGYEIKSDVDSLHRLSSQIKEYDKVFEKNYIVVGEKYSKVVARFVPDYWGIIVVQGERIDSIQIKFLRRARLNPNLDFFSYICMLPGNELKYIVKENPKFQVKFSKTEIQKMLKQDVVSILTNETTQKQKMEIKKAIRYFFKGKNLKMIYKKGELV